MFWFCVSQSDDRKSHIQFWLWPGLSISWQQFAEENNIFQSIANRYLPSSAFLLSLLSRLNTQSRLFTTVFSHFCLHGNGIMVRQAKGQEALRGIVKAGRLVRTKIASFLVGIFIICLSWKCLSIGFVSRRLRSPTTIRAQSGKRNSTSCSGWNKCSCIKSFSVADQRAWQLLSGRRLGRSWTHNTSWSGQQKDRPVVCIELLHWCKDKHHHDDQTHGPYVVLSSPKKIRDMLPHFPFHGRSPPLLRTLSRT